MQNKNAIIGIGILGVIAYLHFRSQGRNSILENSFVEAIKIEDLQQGTSSVISQTQNELDNLVYPVDNRDYNSLSRAQKKQNVLGSAIVSFNAIKSGLEQKMTILGEFQKSLNVNDVLKL
jgi:hypothetical protein